MSHRPAVHTLLPEAILSKHSRNTVLAMGSKLFFKFFAMQTSVSDVMDTILLRSSFI